MTTLITGASGHLGANLVRRLLNDGQTVRALVRRGSNNAALDGLNVERIYGDLREPVPVAAAVRGCRQIHHCAALLSTTTGREREIFDCNVIGTRNLLRAALDAGVSRVVVSGSLSAVGHVDGRPSDETVPFYPFEKLPPYSHTKAGVEHECLKAAADGLDVVIATSCAIIGPNDFKPSRMGKTLVDFSLGKLRAYIPGGFTFVSAADMVEGHMLCMEKGRRGQKYIFSTEFLTVDELMAIFEQVTGHRRPRFRLPAPLMAGIAEVSSFVLTNFFPGRAQRFTPAAVRFLRMQRKADSSKAMQELGYRPTSIAQAVREAHECFVRRGVIPAPARVLVSRPREL
ncbi:MAG TPA: NAD-dependent epimerase/dehydratase family protein [Terriglobia bacterium]|jgi:nucleoside-diphosphate-sugar epimerase